MRGYGPGMWRGCGRGMPGYGPGMGPEMCGMMGGSMLRHRQAMMWAISEGGAPLGTGMPAFAGALSERDCWRIIRYLRTL